jgi:FtsH-binding integral membrane protein
MSLNNPFALSQEQLQERSFITEVYAWMGIALLISGVVAFLTASSRTLVQFVYGTPFVLLVLFILEIGLVGVLSGWVHRMPLPAAALTFLAYSFLNGLTLAFVFLFFTSSSIATTFFVTAGTFGIMSIYGYTTKTDLTDFGNLFLMALVGLILASLVNLFFHNPTLYWIITYAGILIFIGLTAYDTQKIKRLSSYGIRAGGDEEQKEAIFGALILYLDFINLFLFLLRLFGGRKE